MKKSGFKIAIRKVVIVAAAFLLMLASQGASVFAYDYSYTIKNYDVKIDVNEDNSFDITETLDVYFEPDAYKHGIIRYIPLSNTIYREDGTTSKNRARVSNISVNANYSKSTEDGDVSLKIGDADVYVKGDVQYIIKYNYDIGRDPLEGRDEFYFNIIGTQWDTRIDRVMFEINMPKDFETTLMGATHGYQGSTDSEGIVLEQTGRTIKGRYEEALPAYNGLSFRMELPEGYFVWEPSIIERIGKYLALIPAFLFGWMLSIYRRKGRNEKPVETVEFYAPDKLSPLEIGYIYDGSVDKKDVTSYLIELANKGYLEITEIGKKDFEIAIKKSKYEGADVFEEMFLRGLVERAPAGVVEKDDLEDSFYRVINDISKAYRTRDKKKSIFYPTGKYRALAGILGVVIIFTSIFMIEYPLTYSVSLSAIIAGVVTLVVSFYFPFFIAAVQSLKTKPLAGILVLVFVSIHLFIMVGTGSLFVKDMIVGAIKASNFAWIISAVLGLACLVIAVLINKRTEYGNEMLGRIRGFKRFLELAEKPKLEELVEQDPSYFYNILPYTYVLGVSKKWIEKFESIAIEPPTWYHGTSDTHSVLGGIDNSMNSISSSMMSSPSSSDGGSSGGGGGGGSSGGGSGGGGGSSW